MRYLCISFALLLSGCASASGARWFAPATWFSHAPADAVDRAHRQEGEAEHKAIKQAQKSSHETATALASAPASRPVAVAIASNNTALRLLDQVAGPLTTAEDAQLREHVAALLSENAEIRAKAEKERAKNDGRVADLSAALAKAQQAVAKADGKLRDAFERENRLANELRSQKALFWILSALAGILAAGWLYVKVVYGGIPSAAGLFMRDLRQKHPDAAQLAEPLFDTYLSRREQAMVARHSR